MHAHLYTSLSKKNYIFTQATFNKRMSIQLKVIDLQELKQARVNNLLKPLKHTHSFSLKMIIGSS
jgi:hypothetical protein